MKLSDLPEIKHETSGSKGRFVMRLDSGDEAEMTYTSAGSGQVIIDHTGVPDAFRGRGAGLALVAHAVEAFRALGLKVIPLCPFAAAQFRRHPEWADVLKQ